MFHKKFQNCPFPKCKIFDIEKIIPLKTMNKIIKRETAFNVMREKSNLIQSCSVDYDQTKCSSH